MKSRQPVEIELVINELAVSGLGLASTDGRAYEVRNALPGETVRARILRKRKGKRFADGIAVLENPHSSRTISACEYFPRCGGCSLHHMAYDAGLKLKQLHLTEELVRVGVRVGKLRTPTHDATAHYRRKARLGVRKLGEQVLIGFRESFSNRVSKSDSCQTLTKNISKLIEPLKALVGQLSVAHAIPQIEVAEGDREVVLILRHLQSLNEIDRQLLDDFARNHSVTVLLQSGGYDSVCQLNGELPECLQYALPDYDLQLTFDPRQFTQVNAAMNEILVAQAMAYLAPQPGELIADLFCGIGNFSLPVARLGGVVRGYEADATAIKRAGINAALNELAERTAFVTHDLYQQPLELVGVTALLLDPPRSGAGSQLASWLKSPHLARVVYVSCNPVSFATDALILNEAGFELREVGVYDMFPHTAHVETMGYFVRQEPNG